MPKDDRMTGREARDIIQRADELRNGWSRVGVADDKRYTISAVTRVGLNGKLSPSESADARRLARDVLRLEKYD